VINQAEEQEKYEQIASRWFASKRQSLSESQLRALYDYEAAVWGYEAATGRIFSLAPVHEVVLRMVRSRPVHTLLDVGCGPNPNLDIALTKDGRSVVGLELGLGFSRYAWLRARESGVPLAVINGTVSQLPFPADIFDGCICSETLEHVLDPAKVLREIHRVLKPGGFLFLTVPNEKNLYTFYLWLLRRVPQGNVQPFAEHPSHLHHFTRKRLDRLFVELFAVERRFSVGFSNQRFRQQPVEVVLSEMVKLPFLNWLSASHAFILQCQK
jgi:2-polyprenyl-3-methyl-5-hydroxy-6-metoxy-1,4-benzoquinol methylase